SRRRHTRFSRDWSSDVCSSDLLFPGVAETFHRWMGCGLFEEPVDVLVQRINKRAYVRKRWQEVKVLILDEVSMVSKELIERFDEIGRASCRGSVCSWMSDGRVR